MRWERLGLAFCPHVEGIRLSSATQRARSRTAPSAELLVTDVTRGRGKQQAGYHRQAQFENRLCRDKFVIGGRLRIRDADAQVTEAQVVINVLNRMLEFGALRSDSIRIWATIG